MTLALTLKRILLLSMLALPVFSFCQTLTKAYIEKGGNYSADSTNATSYILIQQLADTIFYVRQYDMKGFLLTQGHYKDSQLSVPNGEFTYYEKIGAGKRNGDVSHQTADTINYPNYSGSFVNGKKNGAWFIFHPNGKRTSLTTFKNDKLEGLSQNYDSTTGKVLVEGYFVNDKKEGDWCELGADSLAQNTDIYKHGKVVKHMDWVTIDNIKNAEPNFDLQTLIKRNTVNYTFINPKGRFVMRFVVTREGVVKDALVTESVDATFDSIMLAAISNSRGWKAASKNGQPFDQTQYYTIDIVDSAVHFDELVSHHKQFNVQTGRYD